MAGFEVRDKRIQLYFQVHNVILDKYAKALGPAGLVAYIGLVRRAGSDPFAVPELRDLAQLTGLGISTLRDAIVRMELVGLVEVGERFDPIKGQRGNVYTLHEPNPDGPPSQWAAGFPADAKQYRNLPRPVRQVVELPDLSLRKKGPRKPPPPRQDLAGGPPARGGGATVTRRGGHQQMAGLPLTEVNTVEEETPKEVRSTAIEENNDDAFPTEAHSKLTRAIQCIKVGARVPQYMILTGHELEQLNARPGFRREIETYRKGIGA